MKSGLVIGILIIIVAGALYYLYDQGYFYSISITGVNINYVGTTPSIFKNIHETAYNTSISTHGGQTFIITIEFYYTGSLPLKITSVNVSSPFTLISTSPKLPITLPHDGSVNISFDVKSPMKSYAGTITIYINGTTSF